VVVLVPAHALAGPERVRETLLVGEQGGHRRVEPEHVERAVLVGERLRLLRAQPVAVGIRVVVDVPAGGLVGQPLAHVALGGAGALRDPGRAQRARARHRLVEPELLADEQQRRGDRRTHVRDHPAHQGLEPALVDRGCCHVGPPSDSLTPGSLSRVRRAAVNCPSNLISCSGYACSGP
jgi:hypothetical protein